MPMQKSLSELTSLPPDELSRLIDQLNEPLLVTNDGEPQFVAQSLTAFETMVRRLRLLERKNANGAGALHRPSRTRVLQEALKSFHFVRKHFGPS